MNRIKRVTLLIAILTAGMSEQFQAAVIQIDLGAPAVYRGSSAQLGPISFTDLDGTPVDGSPLSVDFVFTNNEFVRLFHQTTPFFEVSLNLLTNAGTAPGFVTPGSNYLVDQNGTAIPGFGVVGTSDSSNGSTTLGLFPLLEDSNGTPDPNLTFPLDFYGVQFGFTLPDDPSVNITGGSFALFGAAPNSGFAVGPQVPDDGNTLVLLTFAIALLVTWAIQNSRTRLRSGRNR